MNKIRLIAAVMAVSALFAGCSFGGKSIEKMEGGSTDSSSSHTPDPWDTSSLEEGNIPVLVIEDDSGSGIDVMDIEIETKLPDESIADPPHPEQSSSVPSPEIDPPVTTVIPSATTTKTSTTTSTTTTTTTTTVSTHAPREVVLPGTTGSKSTDIPTAMTQPPVGGSVESPEGSVPQAQVAEGGNEFEYDRDAQVNTDRRDNNQGGTVELPVIAV